MRNKGVNRRQKCYLNKEKIGVVGKLNDNKINKVNTFMDDLVAGIASAAAAKIAHNAGCLRSRDPGGGI